MKYISLFVLLLTCSLVFSQSEVDSFYVKTQYNHVLNNGMMTYKKLPVNQKTYNKQGQLVREVVYTPGEITIDYELYYHYDNNKNYLIEKYIDYKLVHYWLLKYKKDKLKQKTAFSYSNGKSILVSKTKYSDKKGLSSIKEYSPEKELIYSYTLNKKNSLHHITEEIFQESDSIERRIKHEYYNKKWDAPERTMEIIYSKTGIDTIKTENKINLKGRVDESVATNSTNTKITTRYTYFPKGEIKKFYSINEKRKYTKYVEYDLKKYYRDIPLLGPTVK
jgi:hypothetical protein